MGGGFEVGETTPLELEVAKPPKISAVCRSDFLGYIRYIGRSYCRSMIVRG